MNYDYTVAERLMRYVQIDTQSNPHSESFPSTAKQKDLSHLLVSELKSMGIEDAYVDAYGYVYATIPSNTEKMFLLFVFAVMLIRHLIAAEPV